MAEEKKQEVKVEQKVTYDFPSETVDLPSGGKIYGEDSPLYSGKIDIKYMTAKEEDILTSQNLIEKGVVIDKLLDSLVLTPGVSVDSLILGDKNAVMVAARILAYGPEYTAEVDGIGTLRFLDAIRDSGISTKYYQASTSELYGKVQEVPQSEKTPFYPRSPYAVAKLYAYWIVVNYREAYNLFACNGILFNHESERRGKTFVTRKITVAVSKIVLGLQEILYVGNLDAKRDWGYAPEYCEGMWMILQSSEPKDYVLSTKETHTVREFIELSFKTLGETLKWENKGLDEVGILSSSGKIVVRIDSRYFRPTEVDLLIGDYSKAKRDLGWEPKVKFDKLVEIMIKADFEKQKLRNGK